jgi:methylmalonyl-CoA mutase cobalamin-binding subunit
MLENRHIRHLPKHLWFEAFVATHELRTGVPADLLSRHDILVAYYSPAQTPDEAVTLDIEKYGLIELD